MSCHGPGVLRGKGCWGKQAATTQQFQTCVIMRSTFTVRGMPRPGPCGHAFAGLWPHQHKPCLAGEGTGGSEGKVPMEVGAGSMAHLGGGQR